MKLNSKSINYNVQTVDELVSLDGLEGDTVVVTDENRGGVFVYREDNVGTNNGGTIFNGWTRQYDGAVNVKWFGAKGDEATDDTSAIQAAIDYASTLSVGNMPLIFIPNGKYNVVSLIWRTNVDILGESRRNTILNSIGTTSGDHVLKAPSGEVLGGHVQYIRNIEFLRTIGTQAGFNAIDLSDASHLNGLEFSNLWFNGFGIAINLDNPNDNFGNIWILNTVVELSQYGIIATGRSATGDYYSGELVINDFLAFRVSYNAITLNYLSASRITNVQMQQVGYASSAYGDISISNSNTLILSNITTDSAAETYSTYRGMTLSSCTDITVSNYAFTSSYKSLYGFRVIGISNVIASNINIKGIYDTSTGFGYGIIVGDGSTSESNLLLTNSYVNYTKKESIYVRNYSQANITNSKFSEAYFDDTTTTPRSFYRADSASTIKFTSQVEADGTNLTQDSGIVGVSYNKDSSKYIDNTLQNGSIIEQGSTSNGNYIKYADGTLINYGTKSVTGIAVTTVGTGFPFRSSSTAIDVTFPLAFKDTNYTIQYTPFAYNIGAIVCPAGNGKSYATFARGMAMASTSGTYDFSFDYLAIGKWK